MEVGVIGAGIMGKNHVRNYSEMRNVDTLYIYDTNPTTTNAIASQFDAIPCKTLDELLRKVEAASICVPTPYHYEIATHVFSAGIPALIEKPICASAQEGKQLLTMLPEDLIVGVGHIERFNPIVKEIQQIVSKPLYMEVKRHNPSSSRVRGTSIIEDLMIHDIDLIFHVFFSHEYSLSSAGNEDICTALITISQVPVYLSASRKAAKKMRFIYVECEDFTIEGNFMTQEITVYKRPGQYSVENQRYVQESVIETVMVNKVEPLKLELTTFLRCVKEETSFPVTPSQAVHNLTICEEIRKGCTK